MTGRSSISLVDSRKPQEADHSRRTEHERHRQDDGSDSHEEKAQATGPSVRTKSLVLDVTLRP